MTFVIETHRNRAVAGLDRVDEVVAEIVRLARQRARRGGDDSCPAAAACGGVRKGPLTDDPGSHLDIEILRRELERNA